MDKKLLMILLKGVAIFFAIMTMLFVMVQIKPLPRGTGFDGMEYVIYPFFAAAGCGLLYVVMSFIKREWEKRLFYATLGAGCLFVVILILSA